MPLIGGDSLLRQTLTRAAGLSPRERTVVVSQQHHAGWLAAELRTHRGVTRLLQPENRDTAAGVLSAQPGAVAAAGMTAAMDYGRTGIAPSYSKEQGASR